MAIAPRRIGTVYRDRDQGDDDSDYGSIDESDLSDILVQAESQPLDSLVLTSIESDPVIEHASTRLFASEQRLQQNLLSSLVPDQQVWSSAPQVDLSRVDQAVRSGKSNATRHPKVQYTGLTALTEASDSIRRHTPE